jgi:serine/threonine-protein kinase
VSGSVDASGSVAEAAAARARDAWLLGAAMTRAEPPDLAGSQFGPYRMGRLLGQGGLGLVYEAVDNTRPHSARYERTVALKITAADLEPHQLVREAQLAAALEQGEHIVPVYEIGEHEGIVYFTMMCVDGGPLATPAPTWRHAAEIAAKIARAVAAAHRHGILHRDLKPANVLVDRESGRPFVTDFGLAERDGTAAWTASRRGGTPEYMAPEAWDDEPRPASTQADIWGVGVILFELLAGRPPFEAPSWSELKAKVTAEATPELPRGVPADLREICRHCLEKDPTKRYATASELTADLERFLAGDPVHARPLHIGARLVHEVRRHPAGASVVAALAAVIVVVASFLIATLVARSRAQTARSEAQQFALETADRLARAAANSVAVQFEEYGEEVEIASRSEMIRKSLVIGSIPLATEACERLFHESYFPEGRFAHWTIFDREGTLLGRAPVKTHDNRGRSYAFRDYYLGARKRAEQHLRKPYVGRPYLSEADERYEISISFPIYGARDQWLGIVVASLYSGPTLGAIDLGDRDNDHLSSTILAQRDVDRGQDRPDPDPILITQRALPVGASRSIRMQEVLGSGGFVRIVDVQGTPLSVLIRAPLVGGWSD